MKRYNVWDEVESLTGDMIFFADHEAEHQKDLQIIVCQQAEIKHLKENDLIQEEEIIKLVEQNREMLKVLDNCKEALEYNKVGAYGAALDYCVNALYGIEKVEGEQDDNT